MILSKNSNSTLLLYASYKAEERFFSGMFKNSYISDESGNVAMMMGLCALAVLMVIGGVVDFRTASNKQLATQVALDNAVLYAIKEADPQKIPAIASAQFDKAIVPHLTNDFNYSAKFWLDGDVLKGEIKGDIETTLLNLMGQTRFNVSVASAASIAPARQPLCFMAMHPTRKHTLELKKAVSVYAPDCHIYGNSDHPYDVVDPHTKQNFLTGKSVQAIGYGHHYLENVTPPLEYAPDLIPDPFSTLKYPTSSCSSSSGGSKSGKKGKKGGNSGATQFDNSVQNLAPGTFCGGLSITNGSKITLKKGIYIIQDGPFEIIDSEVIGQDVTIVLKGNAYLVWEGSHVEIEAPTKGTYTSMAMIGERNDIAHYFTDTMVDIHGVTYIPNGTFLWDHSGTQKPKHKWTVWIIDGVTWTGSGTLYYNFKPEDSTIPYPNNLDIIPRPGSVQPKIVG